MTSDTNSTNEKRVRQLTQAIGSLGDADGRPVMLMVRYEDGGGAAIAPEALARALVDIINTQEASDE